MYALRVERGRRPRSGGFVLSAPRGTVLTTPGAEDAVHVRGLKDAKGRLVLAFAQDAADYAGRVEVQVSWRHIAAGPLTWNRKLGEVVERNTASRWIVRRRSFVWAGPQNTVLMIAGAQFVEQLATSVTLPRATLAATLSVLPPSTARRHP